MFNSVCQVNDTAAIAAPGCGGRDRSGDERPVPSMGENLPAVVEAGNMTAVNKLILWIFFD